MFTVVVLLLVALAAIYGLAERLSKLETQVRETDHDVTKLFQWKERGEDRGQDQPPTRS